MRQGSEGSPQPTASEELRPSVGQPAMKGNSADNHTSLEADPSPVKPQMRHKPDPHLDYRPAEDLVKLHPNYEINICCFKPLGLL